MARGGDAFASRTTDESFKDALIGDISGKSVVDRSGTKWQFDEDGFLLATNAAVEQAQQELRETIRTIHQDLVEINHPTDFDVTIAGVPIDKAKFEK